tara:strand:- start:913 stop:1275 length:363 start_codon:yes stop_codon:yes gene_type:complete
MIAAVELAVGNVIVISPAVAVLSAPKSKIRTDGSPVAVSLKIIPPRAVMVTEENVKSEKSPIAVVLLVVGVTLVNVPPFAVYPVPLTSLLVVYAVVVASREAELVYKAILNVLPVEAVKL